MTESNRRNFLKGSSAAAVVAASFPNGVHAQGNDESKDALIASPPTPVRSRPGSTRAQKDIPNSTPLSSDLSIWQSKGRYLEILGRKIFVVTAGDERAPPLLILHGFPTFSFDFAKALPLLARHFYVVVHDQPGFGLSAKPEDYSYSMIEQAETAIELWRVLGIRAGHLLAHDYGASVATEIVAKRRSGSLPIDLTSLTICNASIHLELAHLTMAHRLLRHPKSATFVVKLVDIGMFKRRFLRLCAKPPVTLTDSDMEILWEGLTRDNGLSRFPQIARYLPERVSFRHRWIGALQNWERPTHILWGRADPVAVEEIARRLDDDIPNSQLTFLDGVGHYAMLESPEQWTNAVVRFLDAVESGNS
ncbi:MAG: pimeloyl-ACP methyl ester carboxylesterase [Verrucomicrobiales bacterium]|jgi:pimeloyl-ACP methyl ester carboxylesterase